MKMVNPRNDLSLFNGDVMIGFFCMLYQSGGARPSMPDVGSMFTNPLVNGSTGLTNIRSSTRTGNDINTLLILGVNRVLNKMKRTSYSVKRSKRRMNLMLPQDPSNFIRGPLNKGKMNTGRPILGVNLTLRTLFSILKSLKTLRPTITILIKNFQEVSFLIFKVIFVINLQRPPK